MKLIKIMLVFVIYCNMAGCMIQWNIMGHTLGQVMLTEAGLAMPGKMEAWVARSLWYTGTHIGLCSNYQWQAIDLACLSENLWLEVVFSISC
jgi:hypothetical protein